MPSSTRAAPGSAGGVSLSTGSTYLAASTAPNTNLLRPSSEKSTRSPSPLLSRWTRHAAGKENQHPFRHVKQTSDLTGRSSSSSSLMSCSTGGMPPTTDTNKRRDAQSGLPPPLTREEFEALPIAIQRKYFSTLERLRFAQPSGAVDGIFEHYCQNSKRRRPRQDRSVSDHLAGRIRRRRSMRDSQSLLNPDSLAFATNLPDKIKKRQFTRDEQVVLAKHLRASVILDAADEAVYRAGRRASKHFGPPPGVDVNTPTLCSQPSMESLRGDRPVVHTQAQCEAQATPSTVVPDSFYDSFRWLDEEEDLDLRLFDEYHANLREALPPSTKERRPSFRRHLSISKIPFGRPSVSSSRPATNHASTTPAGPSNNVRATSSAHGFPVTRRRSRTLSLITAKQNGHSPQDSISPIDAAAAHYQDPEARLKLRVYLASPQKFDEAIEFGFPSVEALSSSPVINNGSQSPQKRQSRQNLSADSRFETFLADDDDDDRVSTSDQVSMADPDSPKTPHSLEKPTIRPTRLPMYPMHSRGPSEGYAQAPASSREMTLRMTLTRPDLRACEDQIYGWQQPGSQARKSQSTLLRDDLTPAVYMGPGGVGDAGAKESIERMHTGFDHWGPEPDQGGGVMKRFWNRVRRS